MSKRKYFIKFYFSICMFSSILALLFGYISLFKKYSTSNLPKYEERRSGQISSIAINESCTRYLTTIINKLGNGQQAADLVRNITHFKFQIQNAIDSGLLPANLSSTVAELGLAAGLEKSAPDLENSDHETPSNLTNVVSRTDTKAKECYKQVYTWLDPKDKWHQKWLFGYGRVGKFPCPGLPCGVIVKHGTDLQELERSDIIFLFYKTWWNWNTLMQHRKDHQKWVFWTSESARHTDKRVVPPPQYADVYDYAMTYRSGVLDPGAVMLGTYGEYYPGLISSISNSSKNYAEGKTKMIAVVATNCSPKPGPYLSWPRTEFIKKLSKLVDIDMFGPCGSRSCVDRNMKNCGTEKYKFYLALENSQCRDYITEKFWQNSLLNGLVPIVFGASKEDYLKVAPPNSFIFVQDFESLPDLADYLKELDRNDAMYSKYHEWRNHGVVTGRVQFTHYDHGFLCSNVVKKVLQDEAIEARTGQPARKKPIMPDLNEWWANSCLPLQKDFPIKMEREVPKSPASLGHQPGDVE